MKKIAFFTLIIILASTLLYTANKVASPPQLAPEEDNGGLQEMGDPSLGFSFRLPGVYRVTQNGQLSRLYQKTESSSEIGPSSFIYISVIPEGKTIKAGEIYNYSEQDFQTFQKSQVGHSFQLGNISDPNLASYFTYTRLEDAMVGGFGAKAFSNVKPWEFPSGTVEYRYIIPFSQATYLVGGYTNTSDITSISKSELDEILSNLKITPDTLSLIFTSPIPENNWIAFSDKQAGISLDYPSGWTKQENSQNFPQGDLLTLTAIGQTQRPQSELHDGVSFSVMKPITFSENISEWVENTYNQSISNPERKPEYSQVSYGGKVYEKAIVCGLGCFTYYHIAQNGKLYGFVAITEGPHKTTYESAIDKILSSVLYF